jgi:hypothetical protein
VALGLGGVGLIAGFIFLGLREERAWLQTSLDLDVGVTAGESAVVQQMADLDSLLAPVGARFGETKQGQVRSFLQKQAQLGLKHRASEITTDEDLRAGLTAEVATLRAEVDDLRRAVGVYCMSYVRSILPPAGAPLWAKLQETLATPAAPPTMNLWRNLGQRIAEPAPGPEGGDAV